VLYYCFLLKVDLHLDLSCLGGLMGRAFILSCLGSLVGRVFIPSCLGSLVGRAFIPSCLGGLVGSVHSKLPWWPSG